MKYFVTVEDLWEIEAEDADQAKEIAEGIVAREGVTLLCEAATELRMEPMEIPEGFYDKHENYPCEEGSS